MNESDIAKELSRRTSLPEKTALTMLHALKELIDEGVVDRASLLSAPEPPNVRPDDPGMVDRLITRAKKHPLGIEFLASGLLATVAITLGAHAFTVEAARRRIEKERKEKEENAK
jgi:hypothetical protein